MTSSPDRESGASPGPQKPKPSPDEATRSRQKRRRLALWALLALLVLGLWVQRCWQAAPPPPEFPIDSTHARPQSEPMRPAPDTLAPPPGPAESLVTPPPAAIQPQRPQTKRPGEAQRAEIAPVDSAQADTTTPYVFADPWGGRHFDSVTVRVVCRESCVVLYSLGDTVQFKTYDRPLTFRRNTRLWVAGVRGDGTRLEPLRIDYVIERDPGQCPEGMMPFAVNGSPDARCIDRYEWPNREDAMPRAFVSWQEAQDTCRSAGKRLCTLDEWQTVCAGPEQAPYPYAARYDERHCPAKETGPARSGHFPVCRSYYGTYDMTGNLWEWTATPHPDREGFYLVAGGNWEAGDQATCSFKRYSFYPQNRFPMVGFRCCAEAKDKE